MLFQLIYGLTSELTDDSRGRLRRAVCNLKTRPVKKTKVTRMAYSLDMNSDVIIFVFQNIDDEIKVVVEKKLKRNEMGKVFKRNTNVCYQAHWGL